MNRLLDGLGVSLPVLAAPMAGGAGTPAMVTAAARAGGMGFLAAGYRPAQALAEQIDAVRAENVPFGVNLFVPAPVPVAPQDYRRYARVIQPEADRYGIVLDAGEPVTDDDDWANKIDLLTASPVPVVSFTFGVPDPAVVKALRRSGTIVLQSVTSADEARQAAEAGVDGLVVQASAAGGHSATFTPETLPAPVPLPDLIADVRRGTALPIVAGGGIAGPADVAAALRAGADATTVGTLLLRTDESGAAAPHKAALADPAFTETVLTRAFTGRPARGLRNRFIERYDAVAPVGYPALHHLTAPLRKAAIAAGDTRLIHLWAGTGYREARAESVGRTLERLAGQL
ncbi:MULTISPECIES: nitronate monooxygenase [Streptomyces]|uniref:nitronate monooxygenase n=1 Tax=Streptomyces TaxID=1883 RepID=UPI0004BD4EC0|nr:MULTISPECIES: nitronate monooxygenase [Streptomyces]